MEVFDHPRIFGPYRLFSKVAQGGMAEVYLATSTKKELQGQFLAIKKLLPQLNSNKPFVNLLIHEAKIGVLLNHPSIAQVIDLGSYKSEFFIAMEFVHGKSLDRILERIREGKAERLSPEIATFIVLETLRALAFAHELKDVKGRELNIIHRDVTPGNILLEYKGNIKLSDFGIATAESRLQPEFTNSAMGKLVYMPPEQAVNDPVLKASDLYSLGVVYYEMLTGQLPFQSESPTGLYRKIVDGKMADIRVTAPRISDGLARIIDRTLDKSVRRRYRNAPELFEAIHQHFLQESDLDFHSRTVRSYYRKKLAEYLRSSFEDEIVTELEVIQRALKAPNEDDELKVTAPVQVPKHLRAEEESEISQVEEATIFEPDHTNEATRHYPLTEDERKALIKGLPPKEVVQRIEDQNERTSNFELVTIPAYDVDLEAEGFAGLSVVNRLNSASLSADQKETLKQQMPALEITSQAELEAFEASTFSGNKEAIDLDSTRGMSRAKIMKDFEKIKKESGEVARRKTPAQANTSDSKQKLKTNPKYLLSQTTEQTDYRPWLLGVLSVIVFAIIASFLIPLIISNESSRNALLPTKQISVVFLGEADLSQQRQFFQVLSDPNSSNSLKKIETLFNREFARYTASPEPVLQLIPHEPRLIPRSLSVQPEVGQILRSTEIFNFFEEQGFKAKPASDANIFVYFYPFDPSSKRNPAFPEDYIGDRQEYSGVVFAAAHASQLTAILVKISREIAKMYGALDKQDPSGLAITPEGIAEPNKIPLFPQEKAELMAKDVPLGLLSERAVENMDELMIGPYTARELGWIDIEKMRELTRTISSE